MCAAAGASRHVYIDVGIGNEHGTVEMIGPVPDRLGTGAWSQTRKDEKCDMDAGIPLPFSCPRLNVDALGSGS